MSPFPRTSTPASHAKRVIGRIGSNPVTWLQHHVDRAQDISPETRAHIAHLFRRLVKNHGPLKSLPDELAEREYIRISFRLNLLRSQARLMELKPEHKHYFTLSKTLSLYASLALKLKSNNGKSKGEKTERKRMPIPRRAEPEQTGDSEDKADA